MHAREPVPDLSFLAGGGEMGERMRRFDWASTPLGAPETWSQTLRASVGICLNTQFPIALYWGHEAILLYNDAWRPIVGDKDESALGSPGRRVWSEIWDVVGPVFETAMATGEGAFFRDAMLEMNRFGYVEECYFDYTFSPIRGAGDSIDGVFNVASETTYRVLAERRGRLLGELAARPASARTAPEACALAATALATDVADVPFALVYLLDGAQAAASLHGATGIAAGARAAPRDVRLDDAAAPWPLAAAIQRDEAQVVAVPEALIDEMPRAPWGAPPRQALVVPVPATGQVGHAAVLVLGVNARRALDDSYHGFVRMIAAHFATAIANARAYEEQRRRAEALAELDRAKTAFFGNVSHEFRTPLTLMLGPLDDLLRGAGGGIPAAGRDLLRMAQRNGRRLHRLVNSLLDFSRIEAGRVRTRYEPVDLCAFTTELASMFRAATERAGLRLVIDCGAIEEPVHVDRDMWEKIVLNLLSNAFKFTFEGSIEVTVRQVGDRVELRVADTGTGIPPEEMPRLFERFHRVENARGRTHEGSGIGLALVQELVRLHGGTVTAESRLGEGSTFVVALPTGSGHLPGSQVVPGRAREADGVLAEAFVEEALRWLPEGDDADRDEDERWEVDSPQRVDTAPPQRILVVDDNADMRAYLVRILGRQHDVATASDGDEAMLAIRRQRPDLVLTDVMMPGTDGLSLVAALRADDRLRDLPVLMLSARAGEEARIEGLQAGADDYLVKPFSARELLARVATVLQLARLRRETAAALRRKGEELERFMDTAAIGLTRCTRDLRYVAANRAYAEIVGAPLARIVGRPIAEVMGEEAAAAVRPHIARVLAGETVQFEVELRDAGKAPRHLRVFYAPDQGDDGAIVGWVASIMDITERKLAEERLQRSHDTFLQLVQRAPFGVIVVDEDFRLVQVSDGAQPAFANVEPVLGRDVAEVLRVAWPEPFASTAVARFRHTLATGEPYRSPDTFERRNDVPVVESYDWWLYRMQLPDGRLAVVCYFYDTTDRRRAEALVREQNRTLALIAQGEPLERCLRELCTGLERIDPTLRIGVLLADEHRSQLERMVAPSLPGLAPRVVGTTLDDCSCTCAEAIRCGQPVAAEDIATDERWSANWRDLCTAHDIRACLSVPIVDSSDPPRGSVFLCFDHPRRADERHHRLAEMAAGVCSILLRREHAESALRESEQRFKTMADTAPAMLWVTDVTNAATFLSRAWGSYTGQDEQQALGFGWLDAVHPDDRMRVAEEYRVAADRREPFAIDYRLRRADGTWRWAIDAGSPRHDARGTWLGYIGAVIDVHERKVAEEALQEKTQELEETDRRKDLFLATLGHELRNPLAALHGALRLLGHEAADAARLREIMQRQVGLLTKMVDDLLEVARITRGKLSLQQAPVDLVAVVRSAVEGMRTALEKKDQRVELTARAPGAGPADATLLLMADPTRLEQVVTNLLANASKYSPAGTRIAFDVRQDGDHVVLTVVDHGQGLRQDQFESIFEAFTQEDPGSGGLGLGLALVKQLVQLHGGTVSARSPGPGRGSTFEIRLPAGDIGAPIAAEAGDRPQRLPRPVTILVVDDHRDNAESLSMLLQLAGARAVCAYTGAEALQAVAEHRPEVAFVDIGLPDMTGYEVAQRIRAAAGDDVVLFALTGFGDAAAELRSRQAGFRQRLLKPVDFDKLHELLLAYLARRA